MKVLAIGDPHFKTSNVQESDQMTSSLIEVIKSKQPNIVVVLGDILHRHEKIHVSPLMRAEKLIRLISELCPVFVLIGNHDRPNNSTYLTDEHPFNAMKLWPNTYVVDDKVLDVEISNHRFLFVPYVFPGRFVETLSTTKTPFTERTSSIFCHQEFFGAKMGAIKSQVGDKWPANYPLVISGHIHDYDKLQENLIYVGTPMQHAFGDSSNKTVSLFNFFSAENFTEERIDLGLIKRIIVYLEPNQIHTYEPPADKLVKIVIRGDEAALKAAAKSNQVTRLKKMGIKICYKIVSSIHSNQTTQVIKEKLTYRDRLFQKIKSDPGQVEWFQKLFFSSS